MEYPVLCTICNFRSVKMTHEEMSDMTHMVHHIAVKVFTKVNEKIDKGTATCADIDMVKDMAKAIRCMIDGKEDIVAKL